MQRPAMLEFQLTPNSISALSLWLTAFLATSFILTIVYLFQFVTKKFELSPRFDQVSKLILAILAGSQILAWELFFYRQSHDTVALWCFALALAGGAVVWQLLSYSTKFHPLFVRSLPVAIMLFSIVELAGFAQATRQFSNSAGTNSWANALNLELPGSLSEKTAICGYSDSGTPITLFERETTSEAFAEYIEKCRIANPEWSERAMLRAKPFVQANCHGWVFTNAQHILRGEDVQKILDDNDYSKVTNPQCNDIVVYRDHENAIMHTGLVRGYLEGAVLVESKWGLGAVYMHLAEEQPYSQNITYYRTNRGSHLISISSNKPTLDATAENLKSDNQIHASM